MTGPNTGHPLDRTSLAAGLLAVLVAVLSLLGDVTGLDVPAALVAAVVLALLGLGGVSAGLRRLRS